MMIYGKKFLKKIGTILLAFSIIALGGCASNQNSSKAVKENQNTETGKKVITDTTGSKVELKSNIEKIAVVPIPWTSIVYAIDGSGKRIVGMHPSAKKSYSQSILKILAPDLEKASTNFVDNDFTIHMEEAKKMNPDVMIVWDYQSKEAEQLKGLGIPAVALKYGTLDDLQNGIKVIGNILGKEENASKLVDYHKESIKYFDSKAEDLKTAKKPKVLYLRDEQLKVAGKSAVNTTLIQMAGGTNVAQDVKGEWINVTMEQVIAWNPDVIIMSNFSNFKPQDILENKIKGQDWSKIDAVKNNKVYKAPMGIYRWDAPCAETPLMIKWMGKIQQPDVFKDYNIEEDLKSFYKKFFNHNLTQEEIDSILQKKLNNR